MSNSKDVSIPLENQFKLPLDKCPKTNSEAKYMSKVPYSRVISCLMCVMVCIRSYLAQIISQVCKFIFKLGKRHWKAIKWIFRYLKCTMNYGIMFNSKISGPSIAGYIDSYYANEVDDRRSITWYIFTLSG